MNSIWIARDKDGSLNLFESKPSRDVCGIGVWFANSGTTSASIQNYLYPEVTWENSPIELVPKIMVDENTRLDECINTIYKEKEEGKCENSARIKMGIREPIKITWEDDIR